MSSAHYKLSGVIGYATGKARNIADSVTGTYEGKKRDWEKVKGAVNAHRGSALAFQGALTATRALLPSQNDDGSARNQGAHRVLSAVQQGSMLGAGVGGVGGGIKGARGRTLAGTLSGVGGGMNRGNFIGAGAGLGLGLAREAKIMHDKRKARREAAVNQKVASVKQYDEKSRWSRAAEAAAAGAPGHHSPWSQAAHVLGPAAAAHGALSMAGALVPTHDDDGNVANEHTHRQIRRAKRMGARGTVIGAGLGAIRGAIKSKAHGASVLGGALHGAAGGGQLGYLAGAGYGAATAKSPAPRQGESQKVASEWQPDEHTDYDGLLNTSGKQLGLKGRSARLADKHLNDIRKHRASGAHLDVDNAINISMLSDDDDEQTKRYRAAVRRGAGVLGGIRGFGAGMLAGGAVGHVASSRGGDPKGHAASGRGAAMGSAAGAAIGTAAGAYLGARRQGQEFDASDRVADHFRSRMGEEGRKRFGDVFHNKSLDLMGLSDDEAKAHGFAPRNKIANVTLDIPHLRNALGDEHTDKLHAVGRFGALAAMGDLARRQLHNSDRSAYHGASDPEMMTLNARVARSRNRGGKLGGVAGAALGAGAMHMLSGNFASYSAPIDLTAGAVLGANAGHMLGSSMGAGHARKKYYAERRAQEKRAWADASEDEYMAGLRDAGDSPSARAERHKLMASHNMSRGEMLARVGKAKRKGTLHGAVGGAIVGGALGLAGASSDPAKAVRPGVGALAGAGLGALSGAIAGRTGYGMSERGALHSQQAAGEHARQLDEIAEKRKRGEWTADDDRREQMVSQRKAEERQRRERMQEQALSSWEWEQRRRDREHMRNMNSPRYRPPRRQHNPWR